MIYDVFHIANVLLKLADDSEGDLMTNLKLQKMLYYQQGFHLAYFDEPLFEDDIEAWMYGPVVPRVYEKYESYGRNGIEANHNIDIDFVNENEWRLFLKVFDIYGQYSAIGLMNMTHNETPWLETPTGKGTNHIISKDLIKTFFKTRLTD